MANNQQLTATTGSQSQTTAQAGNLQPTGQANTGGTDSGSVQPGTATSLLNNQQGGVPLGGASVSTVNLNAPASAAVTATAVKPVHHPHHANPVLLGFSGLLLAAALVLFWTTSRSAKSTT